MIPLKVVTARPLWAFIAKLESYSLERDPLGKMVNKGQPLHSIFKPHSRSRSKLGGKMGALPFGS